MDNNEKKYINIERKEKDNNELISNSSFCEDCSGIIGKDVFKKEQKTEIAGNNIKTTVLDQKISEKVKDTKISPFIQSGEIKELENSLNISVTDENIQKKEYLILKKFPQYDLNEYDKIKKQVGKNLLNISSFLLQKKLKLNFHEINQNKKIGPLLPLTTLIESSYKYKPELKNEMQKKYLRLKNYICNYRTIYGDGNCYYRAVMFRYIELLIVNKKSDYIKLLILDINRCYSNLLVRPFLIYNNQRINSEIIIQIMIIIYELVENNNILEAHQAFYKAILFSKDFDFLLIFYLRFILYEYIKNNENKLYMENFPVLIGNLLPSIYEKDGVFDFNSFYFNYLLKMFIPAEKIIIYLTPFVLGIDLEMILFNDDEVDVVKHFQYYDDNNSEEKNNDKNILDIIQKIFLINRKNHYEIIFNYFDNKNYNDIYKYYRNDIKPYFINEDNLLSNIYLKIKSIDSSKNIKKIESIDNNNNIGNKDINEIKKDLICIKCSSKINMKNKTLKNICQSCLSKEIFIQTKNYYKEYLKEITPKINQASIKDLNNLFLNKITVKILENTLNIKQVIEEMEYNNQNKHFINKLMTQLKESICLYCHNDINNQNINFKLPCGCNFCSLIHLENFFKKLVRYNLTYNYKCLCAFEYKPHQTFELCNILNNNKIYESNVAYFKHLAYIFKDLCCECGQNNNNLISITIDKSNTNFHNLCENCAKIKNIHINNILDCIICNKKHIYVYNN